MSKCDILRNRNPLDTGSEAMPLEGLKGFQSRKKRLNDLRVCAILTSAEVYGVFTAQQLRSTDRFQIFTTIKRRARHIWGTATEIKECSGRTIDIVIYFERDSAQKCWKTLGDGKVYEMQNGQILEHILTCHVGGLYSILRECAGEYDQPYITGSSHHDRSETMELKNFPPVLPLLVA